MIRQIVVFSVVLVFIASGLNAEIVGRKECLKAAFESGDKLLQKCVDAPSQNQEVSATAETYRLQEFISGESGSSGGGVTAGSIQTVLPEITTAVELSSTDVNRVTCPPGTSGEVNVIYSAEKGVVVKTVGRDVFIKFNVTKKVEGGKETFIYSTTPTDIYIVCGDEVYSLVAVPKKIPSQYIRLSAGKKKNIKENLLRYAGMPLEKKIIDIIRTVYTDSIPDGFTVKVLSKPLNIFKNLDLTLQRVINVEGEGIEVREYLVRIPDTADTQTMNLTEKEFLRVDVAGTNVIAIALEEHIISKGSTARLFVLRRVTTNE